MNHKFYDTSSLLLMNEEMVQKEKELIISSITLNELERIKTASNKDLDIKFAARKLLHLIDSNPNQFVIVIYKPSLLEPIINKDLDITDDMKILSCAIDYEKTHCPDDMVFITNDLALKTLANLFFGKDSISSIVINDTESYSGYRDMIFRNEAMERFYSNPNTNLYNLNINEYLIIRDEQNNIVDRVCWTGEGYRRLNFQSFRSRYFGEVKPMQGDVYQMFAADSMINNQITMLCGKPGSGKTYLAFGYLFSLLEHGKIDRIVIFCNPITAKNAAKLGFYPGSVIEKLMATQVGAVLSSKLGSSIEVERLIQQEKLILVPAGDARGYETPPRSGVYIMESQNLTSDLLRMLLQRIGEESKVIVDGDYDEQVDMEIYKENNGMKKMSKVFRGEKLFGQVELKNIYRSNIAEIADRMR